MHCRACCVAHVAGLRVLDLLLLALVVARFAWKLLSAMCWHETMFDIELEFQLVIRHSCTGCVERTAFAVPSLPSLAQLARHLFLLGFVVLCAEFRWWI